MEVIIENITWNFQNLNYYDDEDLGLAYVGIPENMMKRFIKECRWDEDLKVPPHYYEEDLDSFGSDHECNNADTQIVLMSWLHDKQRKYQLDYRGNDPFWIFHDHCHSQNDVYGNEIRGIGSHTEYIRLLEGAEMAKDQGFFIKSETVAGIIKAWKPRFNFQESNSIQQISEVDFYLFMTKESINQIEFYL